MKPEKQIDISDKNMVVVTKQIKVISILALAGWIGFIAGLAAFILVTYLEYENQALMALILLLMLSGAIAISKHQLVRVMHSKDVYFTPEYHAMLRAFNEEYRRGYHLKAEIIKAAGMAVNPSDLFAENGLMQSIITLTKEKRQISDEQWNIMSDDQKIIAVREAYHGR